MFLSALMLFYIFLIYRLIDLSCRIQEKPMSSTCFDRTIKNAVERGLIDRRSNGECSFVRLFPMRQSWVASDAS